MKIRMVKRPPAPSMDGFDMEGLEGGRVYVVDDRMARYLIYSGYAQLVEAEKQDQAHDRTKNERTREGR
jgi:hypothetical protein